MRTKLFLLSFLVLLMAAYSNSAGAMTIIPLEPVDCPDARVGDTVDCPSFEIYNDNKREADVEDIVIGDSYNFIVAVSACEWKTLAAWEICGPITVQFKPALRRDFDSTVTINYYQHHGYGWVVTDIYGRGIGPAVSLSTDVIDFGDQTINTSTWQYVTMKNTGSDTLNISSITAPLGSGFKAGGDCGDTLAVDAICTIQIYFEPAIVKSYAANILINDDAENTPQLIEVSGAGIEAGRPDVNLDKTFINFGNKSVGSASTDTVTVTNTGTVALTITSIAATGTSYSQTNTCGAGLDVGGSCAITVTFAPATAGAFGGTVTLSDNATNTPQTVTLDGKGVSPNATLSPDVIEFGNQTINKSSAAHEIVLLNSGTSTLTITDISTNSTIYTQTNNCSSTLEPKKSCSIYVTFSPTAAGFSGGALSVYCNDPGGSLQNAFLFGQGITGPDVDITPGLHDFGEVKAGEISAPQEFKVQNTGDGDLTISAITANSDFAQENACPETLEEDDWCVVTATFVPQVSGNFFGLLSVFDNATGSPQIANMRGYGTSSDVTILPASINFGDQTVGRSSLAHDVHLLNSGNTAITITGIETDSTIFTQTNDCGSSLAQSAFCTISVTFSPTEIGGTSGAVTITDSASGSPHNVDLTGTGALPVYPDLDISPDFWDFGHVLAGETSAAKDFTVKNTGIADVLISSIDTNSEFGQTNDCPATLPEGVTCAISATFSPQASGSFTGHVKIIDNTPDGYQTATLAGAATHSGDISVSLSATSVDFGDVAVFSTSEPKTIIVTNSGTDDLDIGEVSLTGSDGNNYSKSTNCQETTLDVGKSCLIDVKFNPITGGSQKALVMLYDDASDSPQTVLVSGNGANSSSGCSLGGATTSNLLAFVLLATGPCLIWRCRRRVLCE